MIRLDKLTKYYKKNARGIIDVSLEVEKGEVFGFIGPNGAGKSTTVRTLLNFLFPTSGTASIMNLDIVEDTLEIRKNVGYIPGEINYYSEMKVKDFLEYSTKFFIDDYQERLHYLVEKLDIDLTKKIESLSLGNKKKVAIVQAIIHQPKILIFDEATSGLDPLAQTIFFELLEEERRRGATIFYSSHILSEVQNLCNRVAIIKEGKIIKIEKIEEMLKNQAKNVRIVSEQDIIIDDQKVLNLVKKGSIYSFTYKGDVITLMKMLIEFNVKDVQINEPQLEEVFMHFYEKEVK